MLEDLFGDLFILDEGDDFHPPLALRAGQGVHLKRSGAYNQDRDQGLAAGI